MEELFHAISNAEYRADKTAAGHPALVRVMKSPAHRADYLYEVFEPTPASVFGRALHPAMQD